MFSFCVQKLFLIVFFITISCETKDTCNESCLSKTYSYKGEFNVTFTAKQISGLSLLNVNFTANNYGNTSVHKKYSVSINIGPDINKYHCERISDGFIKVIYDDPKRLWVSYKHRYDSSSCYFTLSRTDSIWPINSEEIELDLEVNPGYQIIIRDMQNNTIVKSSKDLPIYAMNFLKCCKKIYRNDKVQLIVRQTDNSNEFTLLLMDDTATVVLTGSDNSPFVLYCYFDNLIAYGFWKMDGFEIPIDSKIYCRNAKYERLCSWSIPFALRTWFGAHDTRNYVYNLQISNGNYTYKESDLKGPDLSQISQAIDICDGSCLTKAYSYKDVASVHFTAKQIRFVNYLTINLVGFNIKESQHHQVSVSFNYESLIFKYFCERNTSGSTASYFNGTQGLVIDGTSIYRDNTLYCSWTISRVLNNYPRNSNGKPIDLEVYSDFEIILANNTDELVVASNTTDLPIYGIKFLKCCYKVYGDGKFQLIVRKTNNSNEFTLLDVDDAPETIIIRSVQLIGSDGNQLVFECSFEPEFIHGYLKTDDQVVLINSQFLNRKVYQHGRKCSWSIPIVIIGPFEDHDTRSHVYDLKITYGDHTYTESGITLTGSDSTEMSDNLKSSSLKLFSNMFIVFLVFRLRQMLV